MIDSDMRADYIWLSREDDDEYYYCLRLTPILARSATSPRQVVLSGSTIAPNEMGTYNLVGLRDDRPVYHRKCEGGHKQGGVSCSERVLLWNGTAWQVFESEVHTDLDTYVSTESREVTIQSTEDVKTPDLVEKWTSRRSAKAGGKWEPDVSIEIAMESSSSSSTSANKCVAGSGPPKIAYWVLEWSFIEVQ